MSLEATLSAPESAPQRGLGSAYPWQAPLGASVHADGTTFRVWAPLAAEVKALHGRQETRLQHVGLGVWEGEADLGDGVDYRFALRGEQEQRWRRLPDPCTLHQPRGLRGPSRTFDTTRRSWSDADFEPAALDQSVLYELHVGAFTAEGTFDAAREELARLSELGVSAVELMPVAEGPGVRGWGYDGVYISAAHHAYGGPAGLQRFVEAAHGHGIAVILDVVYNHLGASGTRAMESFGPYFTERYQTFWGKAINFDDEYCDPVREWVLQSAERWIRDFHIDGLRLDAIHAIFDQSPKPIVAELCERVHAANPRAVVIAESGLNDPKVVRPPSSGGYGCDAQWADDFHHALRVLLTGEREGYYEEFGTIGNLAKAYRRPCVHDGQYSSFRKRRFGAPAFDRPPEQFVVFSQNHDQVGNRAFGERLAPETRALAAFCVLLSPFVPMLFMGEEYGEPGPFQFFTDHIDARIARATREGRRREFASFAAFGEEIPDPQALSTFEASKLTGAHQQGLAELYRELIRWRGRLTGEVDTVQAEEHARWLRLGRGEHEMICNFAPENRTVTSERRRVLVSTHALELRDGAVRMAPLSGVLLG